MAWLADYYTRRKLTIDQLKVDADLTDFPVLVKLTSVNFNFSKSLSTGFDIRFTSNDGTTLLKYERERHDQANSLAEYWVKVPAVSGAVDTEIYIYQRTADTADGADPTAVWDANFNGVWHKKDITTSTINDSTTNANNGTKVAANEPIEATGKIAKAQDYDGTNDYIATPSHASLQPANVTVEAWIYPHAANIGKCFAQYGKKAGQSYGLSVDLVGNTVQRVSFDIYAGGDWRTVIDTVDTDLNTWAHFVGVFSGTVLTLYRNGASVATTNYTGSLDYTTPKGITLGAWWYEVATPIYTNFFDGFVDEVRVSNVVRSAAWIKGSYNSGNDSLLTYGGEEVAGGFFLMF